MDYRLEDEYGIFSPRKASGIYGPFVRFKGGGGKPPSSNIADTEYAREARRTLYPLLQQGMAGQGLLPESVRTTRQQRGFEGLKTASGESRKEMNSTLARTLQEGDTRPLDYLNNALTREYITSRDNLRRSFKAEDIADKALARDMAAGAVGNEMRMGISGMQAYNNAAAQQMQMEAQIGTKATNIAGGIGQGLMSAYFANQMNPRGAK